LNYFNKKSPFFQQILYSSKNNYSFFNYSFFNYSFLKDNFDVKNKSYILFSILKKKISFFYKIKSSFSHSYKYGNIFRRKILIKNTYFDVENFLKKKFIVNSKKYTLVEKFDYKNFFIDRILFFFKNYFINSRFSLNIMKPKNYILSKFKQKTSSLLISCLNLDFKLLTEHSFFKYINYFKFICINSLDNFKNIFPFNFDNMVEKLPINFNNNYDNLLWDEKKLSLKNEININKNLKNFSRYKVLFNKIKKKKRKKKSKIRSKFFILFKNLYNKNEFKYKFLKKLKNSNIEYNENIISKPSINQKKIALKIKTSPILIAEKYKNFYFNKKKFLLKKSSFYLFVKKYKNYMKKFQKKFKIKELKKKFKNKFKYIKKKRFKNNFITLYSRSKMKNLILEEKIFDIDFNEVSKKKYIYIFLRSNKRNFFATILNKRGKLLKKVSGGRFGNKGPYRSTKHAAFNNIKLLFKKFFYYKKRKLIEKRKKLNLKKKKKIYVKIKMMSKRKFFKNLYRKGSLKKKLKKMILYVKSNAIVFLKNSILNKQIKSAVEGIKECNINIVRMYSFLKNPHNGCKVYNNRRL
jgi:hypothetical protein